ncbi:MAG: DUF2914 domain-containing protein [Desulfuromonadales bacterium]|nr:DUF2914 domain-containing protein [Desulfuromonadales bacterium]
MKNLVLATLFFVMIVPSTSFAAKIAEVSRAIFTTSFENREPVNDLETIPYGEKTIYFFTEVLNADATTLTHLWTYNDIEIARVKLSIDSDRWRTWSSKQIWHLTPGEIKVQVLDSENMILAEKRLSISQ